MSIHEFEELDLKVLFMIQVCFSNGVLRKVAYKKTMVGNDPHLDEGTSLKFHFHELKSIVMNLYYLDFNLCDEGLIIKLLRSLPKETKTLGRLYYMKSGDKL